MSLDPAVLRALQAAGASTDMIIAAVEADNALAETKKEARRANNRERQRRFREARNADNALQPLSDVTACDTRDGPLDKESPQTPKKLIPRDIDNLPACATLDLPEGISEDLWGQYRAMRRKIRKPLSTNAEQLALKHLRKFAEDGHPPGEIVEAAIVGSYQGLFAPKASKNGHGRQHEWGSTVAATESLIADIRAARDGSAQTSPPGH